MKYRVVSVVCLVLVIRLNSTNDFFPFNRIQLAQHDPATLQFVARVWNSDAESPIKPPPPEMQVPAFYTKYRDADGYPIVASEMVNDYALHEAAYLINLMLAQRPDVRAAMVKTGSRMCIIAHNEFTTDLPEWEQMKPKDYWDARARGTGGSATDPYCSCGEENLLAYPGDPYSAECILIHEFAHNIHLRGMVNVDATFDNRVQAAYDQALASGLWKGKYASVNHHEYFAEGVQSWFDNNRENDHDHNHVNTRAELLAYDPGLAALCREVFGDTELKYTKPATRLRDHLAGYDPRNAPTFVWPERVLKAREEIRQKARARGKTAEDDKPDSSNTSSLASRKSALAANGAVPRVGQKSVRPAFACLPPYIQDLEHPHEVREALWGNLMGGGSGVERIVAYDTWPLLA